MDITKTVTHVSLCAGYGGIDFGLKRAIPNLRTIAFSEIEAYACANLVAKMEAGLLDAAPIWTNLKTFPWAEFCGKVDILSGGYPCQPFSAAGKRLGTADPRHLWPFIANGIRLMQPRVCFFENVEGHISLGLRAVIEELGSLGYETTWGIFSAREVGAPHQRKRVFILANLRGEGLQGRKWNWQAGEEGQPSGHFTECSCTAWPSRPGEPQHGWEPPRVVGNTKDERCGRMDDEPSEVSGGETRRHINGASITQQKGQRQTKPSLGGDTDGSASGMDYAELCVSCDNRTDELRLLGNGVVPATAERAFLILSQQK
jgi:site-specific DNA-cytosine methylase